MMLLAASALAGSLYINGVRVENPPVASLESVTVRFDADGNIWVDAPQYAVSVVSHDRMVPAPDAAAAATGATSSPLSTTSPSPARVTATSPTAAAAPVPAGVWWLVVEDAGSTRQQVDIAVNGTFVVRVRSGEPQRVIDLAPFFKLGKNNVVFQAAPSPAATGTLKIYIGRGVDQQGAIAINDPAVRFVRVPGEGEAGGTLSYSVTVQ